MKDRAAAAAFIAVVIHKALSEKLSKHNGWRGVTVPPHLETPPVYSTLGLFQLATGLQTGCEEGLELKQNLLSTCPLKEFSFQLRLLTPFTIMRERERERETGGAACKLTRLTR